MEPWRCNLCWTEFETADDLADHQHLEEQVEWTLGDDDAPGFAI